MPQGETTPLLPVIKLEVFMAEWGGPCVIPLYRESDIYALQEFSDDFGGVILS